MHPVGFPVKMVLQEIIFSESPQDATEDYPQSGRAFQVVRVRKSEMGRGRRRNVDRGVDRGPQEWAADLLRLRAVCGGLRPAARAAFRVRPAVGDRRVVRLRHAAGEMPGVRREGGASSLVRRQEPVDHKLPLVPGELGQAALLAGGGLCLRYKLAERLSLGGTGGFLGVGASGPGRDRGDWRGRDPVAAGSQVPDAGLSDRRGLPPAVVGRQRPDGQGVSRVLSHVGQGAFGPVEVRMQRHVEAVLEGDRQEGGPGGARVGPFSHHGQDEQGDRRSACRRGQASGAGRLRAGAEAFPVVPAEAGGKPDGEAGGQAVGAASVQLAVGAQPSDTGRLPTVLGVLLPGLCGEVPGRVVHTDHAFKDRAEGFCLLNDAAIAARVLQVEALARKILIIDCDIHQGNGTAAIFTEDSTVFTFSIHGEKNFPLRKEKSDLDIALQDNTNDDEYLEALISGLSLAFVGSKADIVIYISGADGFEGDELGRLSLSKDVLAERDQIVLNQCFSAGLPVSIVMAGGYAKDINDTVDIHLQTIKSAVDFFQITYCPMIQPKILIYRI